MEVPSLGQTPKISNVFETPHFLFCVTVNTSHKKALDHSEILCGYLDQLVTDFKMMLQVAVSVSHSQTFSLN